MGLTQKGSWDESPDTMGKEQQAQTPSFTQGQNGLICGKGLRVTGAQIPG